MNSITFVTSKHPIYRAILLPTIESFQSKGVRIQLIIDSSQSGYFSYLKKVFAREPFFNACSILLARIIDSFVFRNIEFFKLPRSIRRNSKSMPFTQMNQWDELPQIVVDSKRVLVLATSLVPAKIFSIENFRIYNVHPGCIPKYRGTGNLAAILNQDFVNVGAAIHEISNKIDFGAILCSQTLEKLPARLWKINIDSIQKVLYAFEIQYFQDNWSVTELKTSGFFHTFPPLKKYFLAFHLLRKISDEQF